MAERVLTVTELNEYVRGLLGADPLLRDVTLRGELSNFKRHSSGHLYFSLKDGAGVIRCAMFRQNALRLRMAPRDGMAVVVRGYVSLYVRDGAYQLYVSSMQPDGLGGLYMAFEALKQQLSAEGLTDPARKRPLPFLPRRVGLVTSPTGAAVQDMIRILTRRLPTCQIALCPVLVQGEGAAADIAQGIARAAEAEGVDVVIVGRGGGSMEDLWAFNEEVVARAIAACPVPVISAVGHETDFTIADFVADVRAATPSNAAEMAVPVYADLDYTLRTLQDRLTLGIEGALTKKEHQVKLLGRALAAAHPRQRLNLLGEQLTGLNARLHRGMAVELDKRQHRLAALAGQLEAVSPLRVLSRGYALVERAGGVVSQAAQLAAGDTVSLRFGDGRAQGAITSIVLEDSDERAD